MDGGRFDFEFENEWYDSRDTRKNLVKTANYEDPNIAKILAKIENIETKMDPNIAKILAKLKTVETKIDRYC